MDKTTQLVPISILVIILASILFVCQDPMRCNIFAMGLQDEQRQKQNPSITTNSTTSAPLDEEANAFNTIFKQTDKSLVTITRTLPSPTVVTPETQNVTVLGSGFLYDSQGDIITNDHVIGSAKTVYILFENGDRYTAKVVGGDMLNDIAVLKIVENLTQREPLILPNPLVIGNSSNVKIGQIVIAVGSPFGLEGTMTSGIVSQVGRLVPESSPVEQFLRLHFPWVAYSIPDAVQTDTPINPGNSGGPLLNLQGQVIGINTAIVGNSNGIGFAIPSNAISRVVPELIAKGNYTHPYLGLALDTSPSAIAEDYKGVPATLKGVFVNAIEKGGPADEAGIHGSSLDQYYHRHSGDMIIAVDGHNVTKAENFISYLDEHKTTGDSLNLTVYRAGKILNLVANLKPWPSLVPYIRQATSSSNPE